MRHWTTPLALVLVATACAASQDDEQDRAIDAAFAELRNGNVSAVPSLARLRPSIAAKVAGFLADEDEEVRRAAVSLLGSLEGGQACQALLGALADSSQDIRERAARGLYRCDRSTLSQEVTAGPAIRRSVELGNGAAAATLLLGYFPGDETTVALENVSETSKPVKLESWMTPVPATLAASVSLTRLQQPEGKDRLLETITRGTLGEQVFLLSVLSDIDDEDALRSLGAHLSDQREIPYGVPSGATPRRRLCDMALDVFVTKLDLELDFQLSPSGRYSDAQLEKVKMAVEKAVNR